MRIIGIDPGTLVMGYGIIEREGVALSYVHGGCIRNRSTTPLQERFVKIYRGLREVIEEFSPGQMAIESLFFCKNVKTSMKLGEARGVALLAAAEAGLEVFEYAPKRVKQAVLGSGTARKQQVQYMIKSILKMDELPTPHDAADALAIALCHAFSARLFMGGEPVGRVGGAQGGAGGRS